MDFFKFISATDPTDLDQGEEINRIEKAMWIERYSVPGEFSFEAKLSTGLKDFLPAGTLISHADSFDVMIVESHEVIEPENVDPIIKITGRSFVSYLEQRIVGVDFARTAGPAILQYKLAPNYLYNQIVRLINDHIVNASSPDDNLSHVLSGTPLTYTGTSVERLLDFGTVWERVSDLLKIDNLGIKTIRKNNFGVASSTNTTFMIHYGVDRSANIIFSWKSGDLGSTNYLFTNKNDKNTAVVIGQYVFTTVDLGPTKYDRRMMLVDATDIDGHFGAVPTGTDLTDVLNAMTVRGVQELLGRNSITIGQTDVSKLSKYQYRRDYDIGDLITLDGNFGQNIMMRVVEYAEIEDENGESGHPTLALPGG